MMPPDISYSCDAMFNSTQLILPILFQLSAFCQLGDNPASSSSSPAAATSLHSASVSSLASIRRGGDHHHPHKKPIPDPPPAPAPAPPAPPAPAPEPVSSYDSAAFSECLDSPPKDPLYQGGILQNSAFDKDLAGWSPMGSCRLQLQSQGQNKFLVATGRTAGFQGPSQSFSNLTVGAKYTVSAWLQVSGAESALVKATVKTNGQYVAAGSVMAKQGCWSFLKGGFIPEAGASSATLYFETIDPKVDIWLDCASLQPFSDEEWNSHQEISTKASRTRSVSVTVTDCKGTGISNADIRVDQITGDFPFGSAIASTILDNPTYQKWFLTRFNTAVFENEMKWYATEREQGKVSYETADRMLAFCKANDLLVRGHNVFWDDPQYQPGWVKSLNPRELKEAAFSRLHSVVGHYSGQLPQWDVLNEMLHFNFFESRMGKGAAEEFYKVAQDIDPHVTLFLNDYNVVETAQDSLSSPDAYIQRVLQLKSAGVTSLGIGLEGHFSGKPNIVYMRAVLDKLGTLGLPIWLTEVDVMNTVDPESQAIYLQQILREAFSHPAVKGIVLWTALHPYGCYRMCLTDNNFKNLPAGNTVDVFLKNIRTVNVTGVTDEKGAFHFDGYHGNYEISVSYNQTSIVKRLAIAADTDVQTIHVLAS